jgi:integrase
MREFTELSRYEPVRNWTIGFNEDTRRNYLRYLKWFCEYTDKDPDQLIELVREDRRKAHMRAKEFYQQLSHRNISNTRRGVGYMAVRSFFSHNDYPLGKAPRKFMSRHQIATSRLLKPREVFDMIGAAKYIRAKAIICFLAQSGQRVGVLAALRYGALRRQIEQGISPIVIDYNTWNEDDVDAGSNKGGVNYRFGIGSECRDYIAQMMNQRKHSGEAINDDSWLFKTTVNWQRDPNGRWISHWLKAGEERPTHPQWLNYTVVKAAYAAGVQSERPLRAKHSSGRPMVLHEITSKTFRPFWKRQMRMGGITDADLLDFMMGHCPRYGGVYDKFDAEYVRKEFAKAEPMLTFLGNHSDPIQGSQEVNFQRIVDELEATTLFSEGWRFVTTLHSGRLVVERDPRLLLPPQT